jgi:hypothetical protein
MTRQNAEPQRRVEQLGSHAKGLSLPMRLRSRTNQLDHPAENRRFLGLCVVLGLLTAVIGLAGELPGLVPLGQASDYPYYLERGDFSLGAKVLSPQEVESLFASDLNRGYIVVEVAVYPPQGGAVELSQSQFLLRQDGSRDYARAAKPSDAAGALQRKNAKRGSGRDVTLYPQVGVGYSTGGPYYGRGGGWNTSVGVGVGVGPSDAPASTEADRDAMETELTDKGLPAGRFDKPVAGYLYFPLTIDDPKTSRLKLDFIANDEVAGSAAARLDLHR